MLRNLSNSKLCFIGSIEVIPRAYAIREPAPEPRPGPTGISLSLAQEMNS